MHKSGQYLVRSYASLTFEKSKHDKLFFILQKSTLTKISLFLSLEYDYPAIIKCLMNS